MKEIIGASDPTIVFDRSMSKCHEKPNKSFLPDYISLHMDQKDQSAKNYGVCCITFLL